MAITTTEMRGSGDIGPVGANGSETFERKFSVQGTDDRAAVVATISNLTAPFLIGYSKQLTRQVFKVDEIGYQLWHVTVPYATPDTNKKEDDDEDAQPLEYKIKWDTGGGKVKVLRSKLCTASSTADNSQIVGWDGKKIEGVEITVPQLAWSLEVFYPPSYVTFQTVADWARNTGKISGAFWMGFKRNELLFLGCSGEITRDMISGQATKNVPVTFHFEASEDRTNVEINGINKQFIVPALNGWSYLDVRYAEESIVLGGETITFPEPQSWKRHQLYDDVDLRALTGIG